MTTNIMKRSGSNTKDKTLNTLVHRAKDAPHTKNILINTIGNYMGFLFAGIYIVFLARVFTPTQFGVLTILQSISYILANILSFGMPATIYAHIPKLLPHKEKTLNFATSNFIALTFLSGLSLLILYAIMPYIDTHFLNTGAPQYQFGYALLGAQFFIWTNFMRDVLNASNKFLHINIALNISHVCKILILAAVALTGHLGITQALIILGIIGPAITIAIVLFERPWILKGIRNAKPQRSDIYISYTLTYFISTQLFQLASRADIFLVSFYLTRPEVGYYGLAQRIILAVVTSADSITQVMSPQFAKLATQSEVRKALKHTFAYMLLPTAMFTIGMLLPANVYTFVFGKEYLASVLPTKLLSASYIPFSFIAGALLFFLYTLKKPLYVLCINLALLLSIIVMHTTFIPQFRLIGPSLSYFGTYILIGGLTTFLFYREYKTLKR